MRLYRQLGWPRVEPSRAAGVRARSRSMPARSARIPLLPEGALYGTTATFVQRDAGSTSILPCHRTEEEPLHVPPTWGQAFCNVCSSAIPDRQGRIDGYNLRAQLTNCTVVGNRAPFNSGGISADGNSVVTINNCILWGNDGPQIYAPPSATAVSYSCVQGGATGTNNISADPRLTSLKGDPRLRSGSPCIDAGSNSALSLDVTTDLSGGPRYIDDISTPDTGDPGVPARAVVDMGAYEYASVPAERLYVNASAPPGGDGASWSSAYRYLQGALAAAEARPEVLEIWVAGGVYRPDRDDAHPTGTGHGLRPSICQGRSRSTVASPASLVRRGTSRFATPAQYPTDLSGDLAGNDGANLSSNTENSYHVVNASWTGLSTLLDGFRISGGNANGTAPDDCGAGIYAPGVGPTIRNCRVYANAAKQTAAGCTPQVQ